MPRQPSSAPFPPSPRLARPPVRPGVSDGGGHASGISFSPPALAGLISLCATLVLLALFHVLLPAGSNGKEGRLAALLIDRAGDLYPVSIQNLMWLVFLVGLGQLWVRNQASRAELAELRRGYLPEDEETVITRHDLPTLFRALAQADRRLFLPQLIRRLVRQMQVSHSLEQASALLNSSLELFLHEIDLRYNLLRYLMWLIPTLGFIGTVYGIAIALAHIGASGLANENLLSEATEKLAVAFDTTLLALLMAGLLVFLMHLVQGREEGALNRSGQYCLDNLINRTWLEHSRD